MQSTRSGLQSMYDVAVDALLPESRGIGSSTMVVDARTVQDVRNALKEDPPCGSGGDESVEVQGSGLECTGGATPAEITDRIFAPASDAEYANLLATWEAGDARTRGGPPLNPQQRAAGRAMIDAVRKTSAWVSGGEIGPPPSGTRHRVQGAPGTGKSHVCGHVLAAVQRENLGHVILCAPTGSAAKVLPAAGRPNTLHGAFNLSIPDLADNRKFHELSAQGLHKLQARIPDGQRTVLVWFDEESMISSEALAHSARRLEDLTGSGHTFGGAVAVLTGDPMQMGPPAGTPAWKDCVHVYGLGKRPRGGDGSPAARGALLYSGFQRHLLTQQMRAAKDPVHTAHLERMGDPTLPNPVSEEFLQSLRPLSREDIQADPAWLLTPRITTSNALRGTYNFYAAVHFGKATGQPVLRWPKSVRGDPFSMLSPTELSEVYEDPALQHTFVTGAPAMITSPINTLRRIVNGSRAVLRFVGFDTREKEERATAKLHGAAPGQVVTLDDPPTFVAVELTDKEFESGLPDGLTLCRGRAVVPLTPNTSSTETVRSSVLALNGVSSKVTTLGCPYELGFSFTDFKSQGQTLSRIVLDLRSNPFPPHWTMEKLLVCCTRVSAGEDMRLAAPLSDRDRAKLLALRHTPEQAAAAVGYDERGCFSPGRAARAYDAAKAATRTSRVRARAS